MVVDVPNGRHYTGMRPLFLEGQIMVKKVVIVIVTTLTASGCVANGTFASDYF